MTGDTQTTGIPVCPIHGKPGVIRYLCCVGAKGGKAAGAWKAQNARANLEKARAAKARKAQAPTESPPT